MGVHEEPYNRIDTALFESYQEIGGARYLDLVGDFITFMWDEQSALTTELKGVNYSFTDSLFGKLASRAHSLAGSATTFGLQGLQEAALQLERTIQQGAGGAIRASMLVLEDECRHAEAFLHNMTKPT